MRIIFKSVSLFAILSAVSLSGCLRYQSKIEIPSPPTNPTPDFTVPDFQIPEVNYNFPAIDNSFMVCNKKDSEMPNLEEASQNTILVQAEVPQLMDQYQDCEGETLFEFKTPERDLQKTIAIESQTEFEQDVETVEIKNLRSCKKLQTEALTDDWASEMKTLAEGSSEEAPFHSKAFSNQNGDVAISLTNSPLISVKGLNIHQGNNVLHLQYFGKCMKFSEETEKETRKCLEYQKLGERFVLLKAEIEGPSIPGKIKSLCPEKPKEETEASRK